MRYLSYLAAICAVFPVSFALRSPDAITAPSQRRIAPLESNARSRPLAKRSPVTPDFFNLERSPPSPPSFKHNDPRRLPAPHEPMPAHYGVPHDHPVIAPKLADGTFRMTAPQAQIAEHHWRRARPWRQKQHDLLRTAQDRAARDGRPPKFSPLEAARYRYHGGRHRGIERKARDRVADQDEDVKRAQRNKAEATSASVGASMTSAGLGSVF